MNRTQRRCGALLRRHYLLAASCAGLLGFVPHASASEFRWDVTGSGNIATSGNWLINSGGNYIDTSSVPSSADTAYITSSTPTPTLTLTGNRSLSVLDSSYADVVLNFGSSTLTVGSYVEVTKGFLGSGTGHMSLTSGTLTTVDLRGVGSTSVESISGSFYVTGANSTLNVSDEANITYLLVQNGATANVAKRVHVDGYTTTYVDGVGSDLFLTTAHTTGSEFRVSNNGYLHGSLVTLSTGLGQTNNSLSLTNGVADFGAITLGSGRRMSGYGVLIRGALTGTGDNDLQTPTGAVNLSINFDVSTRTGYVYSNALAQFSGTITIGGGTLSTTDGSGTEGLSLTGSGMISGSGTVQGGGGGLTGTSGTKLNATGGTLIIDQTATTTFSGIVQGSGGLTFQNSGILTLAGTAANTLSGTTTVKGGILALNKTAGTNALAGAVTIGDGTGNDVLRLAASNQIADASVLTFVGTSTNAGIFRLNNQSETVGGIVSTGNAGIIENESGASGTSTLTVSNGSASSFTGILRNGNGSGTDGTLALTKTGAGTLTLGGTSANTYTGTTTISLGILSLNKTAGINAIAGNATVAGGTLSLAASDQIANSSNVSISSGAFAIGGNSDTVNGVQLTGGSITGSGGTLTSATAYDVQTGTVSAILGGGVGLTKTTAGTVTLSGANTYTGVTNVSAGQLSLSGGTDRLSTSGAITITGGVLDLGNNSQATSGAVSFQGGTTQTGTIIKSGADYDAQAGVVSTVLDGSVGLTKTTAGIVTLSGANTYTGVTNVSAGQLSLSGGSDRLNTSGAITITGGVLDLGGNNQTTSGAVSFQGGTTQTGTIIKSGAAYDAQAGTVSAVLDGGVGLTKTTAGTMTLSGANTYTGGTSVSDGQLSLSGGTNRLNTSGAITITGGILDLGGNSQATSGAVSFQGGTIQTGTIVKSGAAYNAQAGSVSAVLDGGVGLTKTTTGTVILSGANTYTGLTDVQGGILQYGANDVTANTASLKVSGGNLDIQTFNDTVAGVQLTSGVISGSGGTLTSTSDYDVRLGTVSAILGGSVGLNKITLGTVTLAGANIYTGGTTVSVGLLRLTSGSNRLSTSGAITINGGTLDLTGNSQATSGTVSFQSGTTQNGTIVKSGAAYDARGGSVSAILDGNVGLTKSTGGTVTLSGMNTYSGTTTVNEGVLAVSGRLANNSSLHILMAAPSDTYTGSPILTRAVGAVSNAFAGFGSKVTAASNDPLVVPTQSLLTTADIMMSNTNADSDNLSMQWRTRSPAEAGGLNPNDVLSDVISLSGMDNGADLFVLQMSYNDAALTSLGLSENSLALSGELRLGWKAGPLPTDWISAVSGNVGTYGINAVTNYQGSWSAFVTAHPGINSSNLSDYLGSSGVDQESNTVWAVLDHNSEFAVIPEPSTLVAGCLALLGFAGVGLRRCRQRPVPELRI